MHAAPFFPDNWRFDWRSAIIGAFFAWLLAIIIYTQRTSLRKLGERMWAPIMQWRTRLQRSTEEKYLIALRKRLHTQVLFEPEHPEALFIPPVLLAPPSLPETFTEEFDAHAKPQVPYSQLLDGHPRILFTGARGTGRTTTLVASMWHLIDPDETTSSTPFTHYPLWIDLSLLPENTPEEGEETEKEEEEEEEIDAITWLTELAVKFFPQARANWIASQIQKRPSLVLVDNWESVPPEAKAEVAQRIETLADQLPDSIWIIAANTTGYGPLVEADFVPLEIQPSVDPEAVHTLYEGWAAQLASIPSPPEEDIEELLAWAVETGDSFTDLNLRIWAYGRTGQAPRRMHEVIDLCKDEMLPVPDLGEDNVEVANEAHQVALTLLQTLAWRNQTGEPLLSKQEIRESLLAEQIPPAEERPDQLEGAILNLLQETPFLDWQNKVAEFRHPVWQDIWLAHQLAETQDVSILRDHLHDPNWMLVLESYIGMAPSKALVATLLKTGMVEDELRTLLESTRWAILAPDEAVWHKYVLQALAKAFVKRKFTLNEKLMLGKALALVAEESVRPFFLKALRHPEASVRAAAFRGLGWTGQPRDVQVLAAGLDDDCFEVQEGAVRALGDIGTPGAYRLLKDTLAEVDERLMLIVAETLAKDPQGWDALKGALETPDLLIRRAAVHGLGRIDAPWTKEIFEKIMREDTQWLVRSAAEAALQDEDETMITARTTVQPPPTMEESAWLITWAAQEGLGVGVGEAAVKMLLRALYAEDAHARFLSCVTLGRIGHLDHLADLTTLLEEEEDAKVREVAKEAKTQIETRYQDVVFDA